MHGIKKVIIFAKGKPTSANHGLNKNLLNNIIVIYYYDKISTFF